MSDRFTAPLDEPGWVWVEGPIADEVTRMDDHARLARYVAPDGRLPDGQLAIFRWVETEDHEGRRRQVWWQAITLRDPFTGEPMTREPDARITWAMGHYDTWARGARGGKTGREAARARADEVRADLHRQDLDHSRAWAHRFVREHKRASGVQDTVFIGKGIPKAED